jgi:UDP-3-O-[3-hydroxymyristoyl] glucosamine N-acyltransferase
MTPPAAAGVAYTLPRLAERVEGRLRGGSPVCITGVASLEEAGPREASWLSNPKYAHFLATARCGVILVPRGHAETPMPSIECPSVERSIALLLGAFAPPRAPFPRTVHPTAVIDPTARLAPDVAVAPHVVIEAHAAVGARTRLHAGVFIGSGAVVGDDGELWPGVYVGHGCRLGNRVIVYPNSVIGADGFGFYFADGHHERVPHIGCVVLEDGVEVGACTCIDRAKFAVTVVGAGTKIDNLVQVAHNVRIGTHCVLAGQVGIAGSVRIGSHCLFGGQSGAIDNLVIGDGAKLGAFSGAVRDLPAGSWFSGVPAREHRAHMREMVELRRLTDIVRQIRGLTDRIQQLETAMHDRA